MTRARRYITVQCWQHGHAWIAHNSTVGLFGEGETRQIARADMVAGARELLAELRDDRDSLGPLMLRHLRYLERVILR
jgi:hypothetical protein